MTPSNSYVITRCHLICLYRKDVPISEKKMNQIVFQPANKYDRPPKNTLIAHFSAEVRPTCSKNP